MCDGEGDDLTRSGLAERAARLVKSCAGGGDIVNENDVAAANRFWVGEKTALEISQPLYPFVHLCLSGSVLYFSECGGGEGEVPSCALPACAQRAGKRADGAAYDFDTATPSRRPDTPAQENTTTPPSAPLLN